MSSLCHRLLILVYDCHFIIPNEIRLDHFGDALQFNFSGSSLVCFQRTRVYDASIHLPGFIRLHGQYHSVSYFA